MAAYKVIQDIEAEDKLLGPLTPRQFIYALIALTCFYFTYLLSAKGAAFITPLFILPGLVAVFFAIPWSKQQPTEVWALAKIRFIVKPRKRIWDQTGVKELVTINAPKQVEHHLTNGLGQNEVQSRLSALATTLDSRGWAVKNVNVNLSSTYVGQADTSDRLVDGSIYPVEVPNYDVTASDDILDERNNAVAHQFDTMITQQAKQHRQQIIDRLNNAGGQPAAVAPQQPAQDYWFMNQQQANGPIDVAGQAQFTNAPAIVPGAGQATDAVATTPEEEAIAHAAALTKQKELQRNYNHMKMVPTLEQQAAEQQVLAAQQAVDAAIAAAARPAPAPVTSQPDPATIKYASNNDLDIATIARQAKKDKQAEADEVVVSLH